MSPAHIGFDLGMLRYRERMGREHRPLDRPGNRN